MPHIHEKIDWTVEVFIRHKNKVLLRKHDKYGIWLSIGGHIELNEDAIQAAIRECQEEVGLKVILFKGDEYREIAKNFIDIPTPAFMYRHRINETHEHITSVYFATSNSDKVVPENTSDVWQWFTEIEVAEHPEIDAQVKTFVSKSFQAIAS